MPVVRLPDGPDSKDPTYQAKKRRLPETANLSKEEDDEAVLQAIRDSQSRISEPRPSEAKQDPFATVDYGGDIHGINIADMTPEEIRQLPAAQRFGERAVRTAADVLTVGVPTAMGWTKEPTAEQLEAAGTAGTAGSFVGFAVGELPIFLAGGGLLGPVLKRVVVRQIVKNIGKGVTSKFGKKAVMAMKDPRAIAESATAIGIDTVREAIKASGLERDFEVTGVAGDYGERIALNIIAPFIPGLLKRTKTATKVKDPRLPDVPEVLEEVGEIKKLDIGTQPVLGPARRYMPELKYDLVPKEIGATARQVPEVTADLVASETELALRYASKPELGPKKALLERLQYLNMVRRLTNKPGQKGLDMVKIKEAVGLTGDQLTEKIGAVRRALEKAPEAVTGSKPRYKFERVLRISEAVKSVDNVGIHPTVVPRLIRPVVSPANTEKIKQLTEMSDASKGWAYARDNILFSTTGALERMGPEGVELAGRMLDFRLAWVIDAGTALADIFPTLRKYQTHFTEGLKRQRMHVKAGEAGGKALVRKGAKRQRFVTGSHLRKALQAVKGELSADVIAKLHPTVRATVNAIETHIGRVKEGYRGLQIDDLDIKELEDFLPETGVGGWNSKKALNGLENYFQFHFQNIARAKNLKVNLGSELLQGKVNPETFLPLIRHLRDRMGKIMRNRGEIVSQDVLNEAFTETATYPGALREVAEEVTKDLGETAWELVARIEKRGGNAHMATNALNTILGIRNFDPGAAGLSNFLRTLNIITELGLAMIDNVSQPAFTMWRFGVWNTMAEMSNSFRQATRGQSQDFAMRSGAIWQDMMKMADVDISGNWGSKFLRGTGFARIEKWNRQITANAGRRYVTDMLVELGENAGRDAIKSKRLMDDLHRLGFRDRHLKRFASANGLTPEGKDIVGKMRRANDDYKFGRSLTDMGIDHVWNTNLAKMMGFQSSRATQFMADVLDNPLFVSSPLGKTVFQFKTFMYNAGRSLYNDVVKEAAIGLKHPIKDYKRFAPMAKFLIVSSIYGELKESTKDIAKGVNPLLRGRDEFATFDKRMFPNWFRRIVGNQPINSDKDLFEALATAWEKDSYKFIMRRQLENIISVGAIGLFMSIAQSAVYGGQAGLGFFLGGPSADKASKLPMDLVNLFANWETGPLAEHIPVFGPIIRRATQPSRRQLETTYLTTNLQSGINIIRRIARDRADIAAEAREKRDEAAILDDRGSPEDIIKADKLREEIGKLLSDFDEHVGPRLERIPEKVYETLIGESAEIGRSRKIIPELLFGDRAYDALFDPRLRLQDETMVERLTNLKAEFVSPRLPRAE